LHLEGGISIKKGFFRKGIALTIIMMFMAVSTVQGFNRDYVYIKNLGKCNPYCGIPKEEWNKTFGGKYHDYAYSVLQTVDEGYIIVGYTDTNSTGDIWLIKTDENGNEQWNQTFNGIGGMDYGKDIMQTSDGGYIISGVITSMPGPPFYDMIDGWLIKTDENGNEQWNQTFGGSDSEHFYSVQQTDDGGYILTGDTRSFGAGKNNLWLLKTDDKGNEQWNKTFGESHSGCGREIQITSDGGYIITGEIWSYGEGRSDVWLLKVDKNGNMQWNKTFGGSRNDKGYSLKITNNNGFILAGCTGSTFEHDYDLWLIKTDESGNEEWNQTFGGENDDGGDSVELTIDGGYIITGYTESFGAGEKDVWLIKTDENGIKSWSKTFGGEDYDEAHSVLQTSDEGFILTGITNSYGVGFDDIWLIKVESEDINHPPSPPTIDGPKNGKVGIEYEYTFNSTDDDGDGVIYFVDWGDGSPIEIVIPTPQNPDNGNEAKASHKWDKRGRYRIRARTEDAFGALSPWSDPYPVTMPRNRAINTPFQRFLQQHLNLFPILKILLLQR
jgi:hypothetical protein